MPEDTAEQVTEDAKIVPQALKRLHIFSGLTARLKSALPGTCVSESFSARSEGLRIAVAET
jgi:hypothetical protein